ncbi:MAG: hypothetical protein ABR528_09890 [Pseudonocardiaceae bacterium]|jgi:hypothetical protein
MFDALSFAQLDAQQVELLPARTVLTLFSVVDTPGTDAGGDAGNGGQGGSGGPAGAGSGKAELFHNFFLTYGNVTNSVTSGVGGASSADGGAVTGGAGGGAATTAPTTAAGATGS